MKPDVSRLCAGVLVLFFGLSAAPSGAKEPVVGEWQVSSFVLGNGMEVVVIPDRRAPVATHMVWYKVGSADEPPGKSGIAHFFEHLMFKGTRTHAAGAFDRAVAEIGGNNNAFTSYDYTAYFEMVPAGALEKMMAYEADRMRNLLLTEDVIATERDVVLEERRSRIDNDPGALLEEEVSATLWQNQPYRIPVIGWMQEMEQLNRADAQAFYDRYYTPNNAVLVVAGDVEAEAVKAMAERTYGKVARGPDLPPRRRPTEPEQNTRRTVTMADERVSVPSFSMQWVVPSYATAGPGEAEALDLLAEILGGGIRSRLYQELVVNQGTAAGAGASYSGTMLDDTSFTVYAAPRGAASLEDVEQAVAREIARIAADGVTEDELEKAKKRFLRATIFARDGQAGMANIFGSTLATGGTVQDLQEWPARIAKVTPQQVKAAAMRYLAPSHSTSGYLLPHSKGGN